MSLLGLRINKSENVELVHMVGSLLFNPTNSILPMLEFANDRGSSPDLAIHLLGIEHLVMTVLAQAGQAYH